MVKISVIIPVYNTEKYLKRCFESLANQTMQNFEVIIVNDGSQDNSENIIIQWMEELSEINVKYIKKENSGLSDARNYGVIHAKGEYIFFLDSDDYIDNRLFENLEKYINQKIDLIKFKMKTVNKKGEILNKLEGPIFEKCSGEEAFSQLVLNDKYLEVACVYLYRREFFINNGFMYKSGLYHEDFGLTPFIICSAKSVVSLKNYGYNYLQSDNSIVRNNNYLQDIKKANDALKHYDNAMIYIDKYKFNKNTIRLLKRYYANAIILKAKSLRDEEYEIYIRELRKRKLYKNIIVTDIKQLIKKILLLVNIKVYLKMR